MFVMFFKSVHPIIAINYDTRYIDTLEVVSIPVSLSCILRYSDASIYHPISTYYILLQEYKPIKHTQDQVITHKPSTGILPVDCSPAYNIQTHINR